MGIPSLWWFPIIELLSMDDPPPILNRFALRGSVAEFTARPASGWLFACSGVLLVGVLGTVGLSAVSTSYLWPVLAVLLGCGLAFAVGAWVVAVRGCYSVELDFAAGLLRITDVRGLEKPAVWEGSLAELSAIRVERAVGGEGPPVAATLMLLTWQDEQPTPLRVYLAANQVDSAELAAFCKLAAGRGLMSPADAASGQE
jgi:hypothetical protein